jgi:signal transduction histidine kinase
MNTFASTIDEVVTSIAVYDQLHKERDFETLLEKPRILIVDDSSTVRAMIRRTLKSKYDCSEAETVLEAFEQLKQTDFSVVIADVIIPGLSGIELLRKAVDEYPTVAVIMVTGVDRPQRALDALRLGAFDYIIKPFDPYSLELTVERALDRRELLMKAEQYKADLEARNRELAARQAELQTLQVQVVQSEKMASLGRLAAGVAHEVNNPIGFIFSNLELLEKDFLALRELLAFVDSLSLPSDVKTAADTLRSKVRYISDESQIGEIIGDCKEGAQRIKGIVQNLRTFSRLDEADLKETDVNEGIDSTLRLLSRYFGDANVQLERCYGDIPPVECFVGQLNQVWMNVLANAAQALPVTGGKVTITTYSDGKDLVAVEISDTGMGISQTDIDHIFDPFFTTKELGEGTGLGLSISFGIIQKHNGTISVTSKIGKGTTFKISLPVSMSHNYGANTHDSHVN